VTAIPKTVKHPSVLAARIEPYARQEAIRCLSQRFDSDVQLQALYMRLPGTSPLRLILTRGRGISAREGQGLSMRLKGRPDFAPLFMIRQFRCDVNLESLLHPPVVVSRILWDGMEIQIPPRRERPPSPAGIEAASQQSASHSGVAIGKVSIQHAGLVLQPMNPQGLPLRFDIRTLGNGSV
jgi:hypothetical protein